MRVDRDTMVEILSTLTNNKSRSLLTAFGVFWGIFMLMTLVGGGNGLTDQMQSQFDGFATNSMFMYSNSTSVEYQGFRKGRRWDLDSDDIEMLRREFSEIDHISGVAAEWGHNAFYNNKKYEGAIKGITPEYNYIEQQEILYGRIINDVDMRERRKVCVLGERVHETLFGANVDPCGKMIQVDGVYYKVVGVSRSNENFQIYGSSSEQVLIPGTTFQTVYNYGKNVDLIAITMRPGCRVSDYSDRFGQMVKRAHKVCPTDEQALFILDCESMVNMAENLFTGIRILVAIVGMGTLIAGIIGVSNIMMVTVRERTVEIGIRRAIGAQPRDIMHQILAESMTITLLAGLLGVSAGVGGLSIISDIVAQSAGREFAYQVTFGTAVGMVFLIAALGVLAGLAPAKRAMSIKPVEAMRDE